MIPFLVVSFAWLFQSLTGFGAGIFIIGILSLFYDPKTVIVSSAIFNFLGTVGLIYQNRKGRLYVYLLFSLIIGSIPGIYLGAWMLDRVEPREARILIGTFIVLLGFYDLALQRGWIRIRIGRHMGVPVGFLGGLFAGLVGMGGPPPLVFLVQHLREVNSIRLMLNLYFASNVILRLVAYRHLEVAFIDVNFILAGSLGLLFGLALGSMLTKRISLHFYRSGINYVIILLGVVVVISG